MDVTGRVEVINVRKKTVRVGRYDFTVSPTMLSQFKKHYPQGTLVKIDVEDGKIKSVVNHSPLA